MKKIIRLSLCLAFLFGTFFVTSVYSQSPTPLFQDKAIKVDLRHPAKPTNRYIENNQRKKKIKTRVKMNNNSKCHAFLLYESKPKQKREKAINKNRKKR